MLNRAFGIPVPDNMQESPICILTTKDTRNGACAVLYPEAQVLLEQKFPGGCWMIPSSRHEWIAADMRFTRDTAALRRLIKEMNRQEAKPEDRLSEDIFVLKDDIPMRME